ncbi:Y-family DNA polymerase [Microvirga thermotolerans]|uniref:DNA-directed DNA polymerase n=1 Tax=Microvirga thermotolerans TaxID=2651334 RepID=A0A5P9JVE1_9HYPH|nr:DNA polymerase Y family protein [Microvirga thermotolerans]QFU16577.1 DNA polymerase Y family protein [Microvirga thermotolerans]
MRRVVSLFLPTWPTDRIRRQFGKPPMDEPLVTVATEGPRRIIAAADRAASTLGLRQGQTIAHAQALVPGLHICDAVPEDDKAGLTRLALWCLRYSPIVSPTPPDGVWIDIAGADHIYGGESNVISDLVGRLTSKGIAARAAVADAPGTAWAVARYGGEPIVSPGRAVDAVAGLPVQALRLDQKTLDAMHRLGIERVGQLAAMPRAPMTRRFGTRTALRLDQALGHAFEPISPLVPLETPSQSVVFAEPIGHAEDLKRVVLRLTMALCADLTKRGIGARHLDLIFRRVDRKSLALRIGTARPSRDAAHLAKLFDESLGTVDPGFGIDEALIVASRVEPMADAQLQARGIDAEDPEPDIGPLVDRLAARVGASKVFRLVPVESHVPERSARRVSALAPASGLTWPEDLVRPARILDPPEPVEAMAVVPDHPPIFFLWRRVRHRVLKADGPERITGEWWKSEGEVSSFRDYYRVETDKDARVWLFRDAPAAEGGRWWLHGLFG